MTNHIIPANEQPHIRVFAINRAPRDMASALETRPRPDLARDLLNAAHINTKTTEIFPVSDLAGVGLTAYLAEGYAVEEDALAEDRAKLDALDGYVLLLFSDSFGGTEATLTPGPDVTLIGTYPEARANMAAHPIRTASAAPYTGPANAATPVTRRRSGSAVIVAALLVLALLIWWMLI